MGHLTQADRDIIEQHPLGNSLDTVREALREARSDTLSDSQSDDNSDGVQRPRLLAAAIDELLSILGASKTSVRVASLRRALPELRDSFFSGQVDSRHFYPLSKLVIKRAQDVDIWAAVIDVLRHIRPSTPPTNPPQVSETPITHSSASLQGSEQTQQKIEQRVFEEIQHCTHRGVGGFHEKYFQGREWNRRAKQIWQRAKDHYSDGEERWTRLPLTPTEDEVCTWWLTLQQELLIRERVAYFRSTADKKVGTEAQRQLDLFVKMKIGGAADVGHDWKDVLVIGELKKSYQQSKPSWLQIGSAVRNVFAGQPTRLFVHAFSLVGSKMETLVFDRSGPHSGTTFDIHTQPERFIQVMCGYLMMSDEEFGLDTLTVMKSNKLFLTLPVGTRNLNKNQGQRELELKPDPIAHQRAIVCRGTCCFLAKEIGTTRFDTVVKFSWTSSKRRPEAHLLEKAHERGVKGLAKVVGYHEEVTSISKLRQGLVFSTPHKFRGVLCNARGSTSQSQVRPVHSVSQALSRSIASGSSRKRKSEDGASRLTKRSRSNAPPSQAERGKEDRLAYSVQEAEGTSLVQEDSDEAPYDDRILRVLAISPAGRSISQYRMVVELLEGLCDAIKVHRSLFLDGKILHRDISENNIIITDPETADGFRGMLIDLDLAKEVGHGPSGARQRTGTMEFMAIEVLQGIAHTYRHDLEAFFYVLLWLCARRGWALSRAPGLRPEESFLSRWYSGTYKTIAQNKIGDMSPHGLNGILKEFPEEFDGVKPLCRKIRDILFLYRGDLFTGTPQDPEVLYTPMIAAFEDAITSVKQEEFEGQKPLPI